MGRKKFHHSLSEAGLVTGRTGKMILDALQKVTEWDMPAEPHARGVRKIFACVDAQSGRVRREGGGVLRPSIGCQQRFA